MAVVRPTLYCADAATWESWLEANAATSEGVRLAIAKKGGAATSVSYAQALDSALCVGWIDGQKWSLDDSHFLQGFGPRRPRSMWSRINRDKVAALLTSGRMRPAGLAEVERAQADGRWDAAYAGSSTIELPDDFAAAIAASPAASAFYPTLSSQNRFAIIFRTNSVRRADTRERKIAQYVEMLERGETIYPQGPVA